MLASSEMAGLGHRPALHRFSVMQAVHAANFTLADSPSPARRLRHREWVVASLVERDRIEVVAAWHLADEVHTGLHQLRMRDHDVCLLAFLLDPCEPVRAGRGGSW
jgi:hypothetical protein